VIAKNHDCVVLALLAQKGGVGKTTLAIHLAVLAEQEGLSVLLVDTDPQRSLAGWWRRRAAETPPLVETTPGGLRTALAAARAGGVDLVVVDSQPSVTPDTATVARAADLSLIPVRASSLDMEAIAATVSVVKATRRPAAIVRTCPTCLRWASRGRGGQEGPGGVRLAAGPARHRAPGQPGIRADRSPRCDRV
jgi:chromosome partitioning protein